MVLHKIDDLPSGDWQRDVTFPDWEGSVDNSLPVNSSIGFFGYHGQGKIFLVSDENVESFTLYVNGKRVENPGLSCSGSVFETDISDGSLDGMNMVQVLRVVSGDGSGKVRLLIPYPVILEGDDEERLPDPLVTGLIRDIIESDISYGFPSAQWSYIRDGKRVFSGCSGRVNAYHRDGTRSFDEPPVTENTLYDLASVTKMMATNFALQKLITDGLLNLEDRIVSFFGQAFVDETLEIHYQSMPDYPGLETVKAWKSKLTVRDLMCHEGGFPADPGYYNKKSAGQLFSGYGADAETRENTKLSICRTPLMYEPGTRTVYSDVDYMILGMVAEIVSGTDLDTYLKKTFFRPLGLEHITFNPLKNGFSPLDCAATELQGNTRDGHVSFEGNREYTLRGEVHDGKAYHCMSGISGHAGLFGNARDLSLLASVMLCGGYGNHRFFSRTVMDLTGGPKNERAGNWGIGWWRQGEDVRVTYFGTQSDSFVIGHQGWTGTLIMIDPHNRSVLAYLTNKINSPVTDGTVSKDRFDGNWFTASSLGFVSQLLSLGYQKGADIKSLLPDMLCDMVEDAIRLIPARDIPKDHPAVRNVLSKIDVLLRYAGRMDRPDLVKAAQEQKRRYS